MTSRLGALAPTPTRRSVRRPGAEGVPDRDAGGRRFRRRRRRGRRTPGRVGRRCAGARRARVTAPGRRAVGLGDRPRPLRRSRGPGELGRLRTPLAEFRARPAGGRPACPNRVLRPTCAPGRAPSPWRSGKPGPRRGSWPPTRTQRRWTMPGPMASRSTRATSSRRSPDDLHGQLDVVVAVVPYVPTAALTLLPRDTLTFEDVAHYDGGPDGTALLERVAAEAPAFLRERGAAPPRARRRPGRAPGAAASSGLGYHRLRELVRRGRRRSGHRGRPRLIGAPAGTGRRC